LGGFGGGGFPGFGGGGATTPDATTGHTGVTRVSATSDDHSNSLIVSAPEDLMDTISNLVSSVDVPVEDQTAIEAIHLLHSDPQEMADLLSNLFPDSNSQNDASRSFQFGRFGGFPFGGGQRATSGTDQSDRMKLLTKVNAVADKRTASVVISASRAMMPGISNLVVSLDANTSGIQKVHVVALHNADVQDVLSVLQDTFTSANNTRSSSSTTLINNNALTTRSTTLQQQQNSTIGSSMGGGSTGGKSSIP
jgi:type II secretory pathway component GspD/PulD (secretin)